MICIFDINNDAWHQTLCVLGTHVTAYGITTQLAGILWTIVGTFLQMLVFVGMQPLVTGTETSLSVCIELRRLGCCSSYGCIQLCDVHVFNINQRLISLSFRMSNYMSNETFRITNVRSVLQYFLVTFPDHRSRRCVCVLANYLNKKYYKSTTNQFA